MGIFGNIQLAILERMTARKYLKVKGQVEMYLGMCLKARGDLLESAKSGKAEYSLEEAKETADKPIKSFQADLDEMLGLKDMFVAGMESLRHHHIAKCLLLIQDWRSYLSALEKKNRARSLWIRRAEFAPDGGGKWVEAEKDSILQMAVIKKRILERLGTEEASSKTDPTSGK